MRLWAKKKQFWWHRGRGEGGKQLGPRSRWLSSVGLSSERITALESEVVPVRKSGETVGRTIGNSYTVAVDQA